MRKRLFSLLSLMVMIFVLVSCGASAGSERAQLAFEAQMNVDSGQRFHVSLGVRNMGEARFRDYQAFNGTMELHDEAGENLGSIAITTLWELAPGNAGWPAAYASKLPAGAYQLTWGSPDYSSIVIDFTIVELDGWLYLGEQSIQSTAGVTPEDDDREYGALQSLVDLARVNLAQKLGVETEAVAVQTIEEAEFPDGSLGVPEPGQMYVQVLTPGYAIKLVVEDKVYEYRASDRRLVFVPGQAQAPQHDATDEVGQDGSSDVEPPLAILEISGQEQVSGIGTYCWKKTTGADTSGLCADMAGIPTAEEPLVVSSPFGANFRLAPEETPDELLLEAIPVTAEDEIERWPAGSRGWAYKEAERYNLPLEREPSIELSLEPGLYVLNLMGRWQAWGDASYGFLVSVEGR